MRALVFVKIIEYVAHAHAQNAPLEWFSSTPGMSRAEGTEGDLLVVYPVIHIHGLMDR